MNINPTITLSIIVALVALVAPILTSILSNIHDTRIKALQIKDVENQHIREVFENFLSCYGELAGLLDHEISVEKLSKLRSATLKCFPYIPDEHHDLFFNLYDGYYTGESHGKIPREIFAEVLPIIREILKDLRNN